MSLSIIDAAKAAEILRGRWEQDPLRLWTPGDRQLSDMMQRYWSNFAKGANPNGAGLPNWPMYDAPQGWPVMYLTSDPSAHKDDQRDRYLFLSREWSKDKSGQ